MKRLTHHTTTTQSCTHGTHEEEEHGEAEHGAVMDMHRFDGVRWCQMVSGGVRWCQMVADGGRWCQIGYAQSMVRSWICTDLMAHLVWDDDDNNVDDDDDDVASHI